MTRTYTDFIRGTEAVTVMINTVSYTAAYSVDMLRNGFATAVFKEIFHKALSFLWDTSRYPVNIIPHQILFIQKREGRLSGAFYYFRSAPFIFNK